MSKLWAADPHQYGPGKVHIIDDKEQSKTLCGRFLNAFPGSPAKTDSPTCRICINNLAARPERERRQQEYEQRRHEYEQQKARENQAWWDRYNAYLRSPEWARVRAKVLKRANGICEGCGDQPATQVHHLTYAHVCDEFLWELRAICDDCHERAHPRETENADADVTKFFTGYADE